MLPFSNCQDPCLLPEGTSCLLCRTGYELIDGLCVTEMSLTDDNSPFIALKDIPTLEQTLKSSLST